MADFLHGRVRRRGGLQVGGAGTGVPYGTTTTCGKNSPAPIRRLAVRPEEGRRSPGALRLAVDQDQPEFGEELPHDLLVAGVRDVGEFAGPLQLPKALRRDPGAAAEAPGLEPRVDAGRQPARVKCEEAI